MNGLLPFDQAVTPTDALPSLDGVTDVVLDTETTGLNWIRGDRPVGLAVAYGDQRRYFPFAHRGGGNLDEGVVKRWAQTELRGKRIIGLNLRFDLHMLRCWGADLRDQGNTFHDVGHAAALLDDHRTSFALDALAREVLGAGKTDIGRPEHIADLPGNVVADYAKTDVDLTQRLDAAYQPRLAAEDLLRVQAVEDQIIPVVVEMESHGLPLDLETLARWTVDVDRLATRLAHDLQAAAGFACNPDKKDHLARLFHRAGLSYGRTPTGQPAFPAEVVAEAATKDPAIRLAWRLAKLRDLQSKVLVPFATQHVGGTLYPSYHQLRTDEGGTISGRFASSNPNGQNLPNADKFRRMYGWVREYGITEEWLARALVVPGEGVWLSADQKQVEYRVAAAYANDPRMVEVYRQNPETDFHDVVKGMIAPIRPTITRTEVKVAGFSQLYGGGLGTLARLLGVDEGEAEAVRSAYKTAFPAFDALARRAMRRADEIGYVRTILGRRCRFLGSPGARERVHKALNAVIQGTAADLNKMTLVALYAERARLGLTMRATVHDEIDGDFTGAVPDVLDILNVQRVPFAIPILWSAGTGRNWAEAK